MPKVLLMAEQNHFTSFSEIGTGIAAGILGNHARLHRVGHGKSLRRKALNQTVRRQYYVYRVRDGIWQRKLCSAHGIRTLAPSWLVYHDWIRGFINWERDANQLPMQWMPTLAVKKNDLKVSGVTNLAEADQ